MAQAQAAANDEQHTEPLAVKIFKQSGVEVSAWRNPGQNGDMYNTAIRNTYKDEKSGGLEGNVQFQPDRPRCIVTTLWSGISGYRQVDVPEARTLSDSPVNIWPSARAGGSLNSSAFSQYHITEMQFVCIFRACFFLEGNCSVWQELKVVGFVTEPAKPGMLN
jgi:hypothetical protein